MFSDYTKLFSGNFNTKVTFILLKFSDPQKLTVSSPLTILKNSTTKTWKKKSTEKTTPTWHGSPKVVLFVIFKTKGPGFTLTTKKLKIPSWKKKAGVSTNILSWGTAWFSTMICWGIWDTGRHSFQAVLCKDPSKSSQRISSLTSTSKHKIEIWRQHLLSHAWPLNGVRLQRQICMTWLLASLTSTRSKCSCWSLTTKSG